MVMIFFSGRVNALEDRVERGGLAAAGRAGRQEQAVRLLDQAAQQRRALRIETQFLGVSTRVDFSRSRRTMLSP